MIRAALWPKETKAQAEARKTNREGVSCKICGGWHHPKAVHLDYVGHAALTDRLLDVDPEWSWEPVAFNQDGLPAFDRNGGLWIRLTILGVTRLGYGAADGKSGGDAIKEIIGDALRNAAMRFGAALDLWHKGDLHLDEAEEPTGGHSQGNANGVVSPRQPKHSALRTAYRQFVHEANGCGDADELSAFLATADSVKLVAEVREKLPHIWDGENWPADSERPDEWEPLCDFINRRQRECAQATADYLTVCKELTWQPAKTLWHPARKRTAEPTG